MACHGKQLGIPITCVLPRFIPLSTISLCKDFGAKVVVQGINNTESRKVALELAQKSGGEFIDGHDHIDIIAGAGTIALEIFEDVKDVDVIVVPVGGGGLLAGITAAVRELSPKTRVIGVESKASHCFSEALKNGKPVNVQTRTSLSPSLAMSRFGYNSFNIIKGTPTEVAKIKEMDLARAILIMLENHKFAVEGAGALAPAAVMTGQVEDIQGKKVVCVISGGNVDSTMLGQSIDKGLIADDRLALVEVFLPDRPGGLCELLELTSSTGAKTKHIYMEHVFHKFDIFTVKMKLEVVTSGMQHSEELRKILEQRYGDDLSFHMRKMRAV
ncbi:unnamed protein product [Cylicocyclus nassatus]|uniref:L-serine deaminase n=1 Tax=Cylicocyclus nassatus TaxID=53992 RepID=A0AA36H1C6_CYLNA|nr:unnamed protein product [Cylicocyclus nassatus]